MKLKILGILVMTAAMLTVMTTATAFAATWSPGLDQSKDPVGETPYYDSGYSPSSQNVPDVYRGNYATWVNNMQNNCGYYRWPSISWSDSFGQSGFLARTSTISGNGGVYSPDPASIYAPPGYVGLTDSVFVSHWYTQTYQGDGPHVSGTQRFRIT